MHARRAELTNDGHDDDGEVEDVPRVLEVVVTQADQLDEALGGEDGDEDDVDDLQDELEVLGRLVVLDRHREHVEQDDDHDEDVELLVGGQFEHGQRTLQLRRQTTR